MRLLTRLLVVSICLTGGGLYPDSVAFAACDRPVATLISLQGTVEVRQPQQAQWIPASLETGLCPGDILSVSTGGRAAVQLLDHSILRLDQKTTLVLPGVVEEKSSWLEILEGTIHFISRLRRALEVKTPYVNASVEGTEFVVRVAQGQTLVAVLEGRVAVQNELGRLVLADGQSAVTLAGNAPVLRLDIRPEDTVRWSLYYPSVLYRQEAKADPDILRAENLLAVGRAEEADQLLVDTLSRKPGDATALALQAIIALTLNEKARSLTLAEQSVAADPDIAATHLALSYAQQSGFDLTAARESARHAVSAQPDNALAWARLAELQLSLDEVDAARAAAQKAAGLDAELGLAHTVLGFVKLREIKIEEAADLFTRASTLAPAAPLPRLGLGLAQIRSGKLAEGRRNIEVAASLDPNNPLVRSYLGKAYYEEKRNAVAAASFSMAKELDPQDPTPWFYDAIRKQTENRPIEALHDLQKSIELNDNRAVYRSRLLLDSDLAARSASLGRIYNDLGFQQLGLVEGWKSVNTDPANYSAHRFLADNYAGLRRHQIARVSELLQSQLLQPLNITPIQPELAETDLFVISGGGPTDAAFNEFNPAFSRDRFTLQAGAVLSENDTFGNSLVHSGLQGRFSYSAGMFHYKTDGFRENNDLEQDIYNLFAQVSLTPSTSLQAEVRKSDLDNGDLLLRLDPDNFIPGRRQETDTETTRFGLHHAFSPRSDLLLSFIHHDDSFSQIDPNPGFPPFVPPFTVSLDEDTDGNATEVQYLYRGRNYRTVTGASHFTGTVDSLLTGLPLDPPVDEKFDIDHSSVYLYSYLDLTKDLGLTVGASADTFESITGNHDKLSPKVGLIWHPAADTTIRLAAFQAIRKPLLSTQTIEPTQVSGFNQLYDDLAGGTESRRYGLAIDRKITSRIYAGAELSKRELEVPFFNTTSGAAEETDMTEADRRAYLFWTPTDRVAARAEYLYEDLDFGSEFPIEDAEELNTERTELSVDYFHPNSIIAGVRAAYVDQEGKTRSAVTAPFITNGSHFWVVDVSMGYRLPKRLGIVGVTVKNLFNEEFKFQDADASSPLYSPERLFLLKLTLALD